jgi:hypothetical protein
MPDAHGCFQRKTINPPLQSRLYSRSENVDHYPNVVQRKLTLKIINRMNKNVDKKFLSQPAYRQGIRDADSVSPNRCNV